MGINIRNHTYPQRVRVHNIVADGTSLADTTTEASLPGFPTFDVLDRPFAVGDSLEIYLSAIMTNNATVDLTVALFWGTQAGTLLVRTAALGLIAADSGPHLLVRASITFRSATSVVGAVHAHVGQIATGVEAFKAFAAVTVAQTANAQGVSIALDWSAATVGTAVANEYEVWFSRNPTP